MDRVKIVHTNDLHSHFETFPKIERFIANKRQEANEENEKFLLFDIGDFSDRVHPLTEATDGKANVEWMNKQKYDLVTIGNNEGLGNSHQQLIDLFADKKFSLLIGNLKDKKTEKLPDFADLYHTYEVNGNKIGVIALTAPYILTYPLIDWDILLIQDVLDDLIKTLKEQGCGIIILMSHLGISADMRIANEDKGIDLIVGAHTHHLFPTGEHVKNTYLAAAGKYGEYIGEIDLEVENNKLLSADIKTYKTSEMSEEENDNKVISEYNRLGKEILSKEKIVTLPYELNNDFTSEHSNIKIALEAIEDTANTDIAVLNNGLFLKELTNLEVTKDDIHELLPHAMHVMKVSLKGQDLWRLFLEMEFNRLFLRRHQQKGMGFRGKYFGELVYDGVEVDLDKRKVLVHHKEIEPDKIYELAALDHYLFVPYFPTIKIMGENKLYYPKFLRDVYSEYLVKKFGN